MKFAVDSVGILAAVAFEHGGWFSVVSVDIAERWVLGARCAYGRSVFRLVNLYGANGSLWCGFRPYIGASS